MQLEFDVSRGRGLNIGVEVMPLRFLA